MAAAVTGYRNCPKCNGPTAFEPQIRDDEGDWIPAFLLCKSQVCGWDFEFSLDLEEAS